MKYMVYYNNIYILHNLIRRYKIKKGGKNEKSKNRKKIKRGKRILPL